MNRASRSIVDAFSNALEVLEMNGDAADICIEDIADSTRDFLDGIADDDDDGPDADGLWPEDYE